jgi:sulfatase maturation enzyme AslB (radical SAM superfamily)
LPENKPVFTKIHDVSAPIFCSDQGEYLVYYAPGYLAVVDPQLERAATNKNLSALQSIKPIFTELRQHARIAVEAWRTIALQPFTPLCLTLYLHNECNLHCTYCFADPSLKPAPRLSLAAVKSSARLVLSHCQAQDRPFTLVCHGGGEPTLHRQLLTEVLEIVTRLAANAQIPLMRYIATNGVISTAKAHWLAQNFDLIGLSCDGPPHIQNEQRPLQGGGSSSEYVKRTAGILHTVQTPFDVRATVTNKTAHRQPEIADYICRELRPREIHVEPVYSGGRAKIDAEKVNATRFVNSFLEAKQVAEQYGIPWRMSGSRPEVIHGPHCNQFRYVVNVIPGSVATSVSTSVATSVATTCFKATRATTAQQAGLQIGAHNETDGCFHMDMDAINDLAGKLHPIPDFGQDCFNQYHCVRGCPDHCPLDAVYEPGDSFRCQINRQLAGTYLQETAVSLWQKVRFHGGVAGQKIGVNNDRA